MCIQCARLEERIEILELELRDLGRNPAPATTPVAWALEPKQRVILSFLMMAPGIASSAKIITALYGLDADQFESPEVTLRVHICRLNKALRPHSMRVLNVRDSGYYIDPESKRKIAAICQSEELSILSGLGLAPNLHSQVSPDLVESAPKA